jgi:hypothetical protein
MNLEAVVRGFWMSDFSFRRLRRKDKGTETVSIDYSFRSPIVQEQRSV